MDIFGLSFEFLPQLKNHLESIAKRSGLTANEALVLIVFAQHKESADLFDSRITESLVAKGVLNADLSLTNKGAIVAKAIIMAKEKFAETISL